MKCLKLAFVLLVIVLMMALAAVSVGHLGRNSVLPEPAALSAISKTENRIEGQRYRLDASQSKFIAHAMAGGLLWFKGHDHLVAVKEFTGEARLTPDQINPASLEITAKTGSMVETSSVFTDQQKQIIDKELREIVLLPARYPDITFKSTEVKGKASGSNEYDLKIGGDLTLLGVTRHIEIPTHVTISGIDLYAGGNSVVNVTLNGVDATARRTP